MTKLMKKYFLFNLDICCTDPWFGKKSSGISFIISRNALYLLWVATKSHDSSIFSATALQFLDELFMTH